MESYKEIFEYGYARGFAAAKDCEVSAGSSLDDIVQEACEAEEHNRSFTPFEFVAHRLNVRDDSEEAWEHFDQGISSGIAAGAAQRAAELGVSDE